MGQTHCFTEYISLVYRSRNEYKCGLLLPPSPMIGDKDMPFVEFRIKIETDVHNCLVVTK